jgi:hypothetical protein
MTFRCQKMHMIIYCKQHLVSAKNACFSFSKVPSMSFYPDFILILSRFYLNCILIRDANSPAISIPRKFGEPGKSNLPFLGVRGTGKLFPRFLGEFRGTIFLIN